jgi:hypothetical protein
MERVIEREKNETKEENINEKYFQTESLNNIINTNANNNINNTYTNTDSNINTFQINNLSKIRKILDLPKQYRTEENIKFLYENFKDLSFFRLGIIYYGKEIIEDILKCCCLLDLNYNSVILNSRENAKSAYILVTGEILISTKEAIYESNPKKNVRRKISTEKLYKAIETFGSQSAEIINNRKCINFFEENSINNNDIYPLTPKLKNAVNLMNENWFVKIGEMFGDKSLLERKIRYLLIKFL